MNGAVLKWVSGLGATLAAAAILGFATLFFSLPPRISTIEQWRTETHPLEIAVSQQQQDTVIASNSDRVRALELRITELEMELRILNNEVEDLQ